MAIEFSTDENHMFFRCAGRLLITRKLTGQFPDYDRVLPADPGEGVNLNKIEPHFSATTCVAVRRRFAPGRFDSNYGKAN